MTRLRTVKTSFTAGEIAPRLFGRTDLRAHANGARRLENVFIHPTGGLSRRAGLAFVDRARGPGRLVAFAFNTEQTYLLAFSAGAIDVYRDDVRLATVTAPWTEAQLAQIAWTQSADTLLVCHPDVAPRRVTRRADLTWQIDEWSWVVENGAVRQPWYRFAPADVTIAASATTGSVTLVASAAALELNFVRDCGGVGDGTTLNDDAWASCTSRISAAAGGTIYVPSGDFLSSPFNITTSSTTLILGGGATLREAHLAMEIIHDANVMVAMDLVEINPILDHRNATAELAAELIASAFGRRIL
jgi:hypothetical protein